MTASPAAVIAPKCNKLAHTERHLSAKLPTGQGRMSKKKHGFITATIKKNTCKQIEKKPNQNQLDTTRNNND